MAKINGHRYEERTEAIDELIEHFLESGWVVCAMCEQGRHRFCAGENAEDCWCECREADE